MFGDRSVGRSTPLLAMGAFFLAVIGHRSSVIGRRSSVVGRRSVGRLVGGRRSAVGGPIRSAVRSGRRSAGGGQLGADGRNNASEKSGGTPARPRNEKHFLSSSSSFWVSPPLFSLSIYIAPHEIFWPFWLKNKVLTSDNKAVRNSGMTLNYL